MFTAYTLVSVVLAAALTLAAAGMLTKSERTIAAVRRVDVPDTWLPWLTTAQLAGAAGLLVGILIAPLGIAAATCLVIYFLGAVAGHLRAGDVKGLSSPMPLLVLALSALLLRITT